MKTLINCVEQVLKEQVHAPEWQIFHIKQTMYVILFIIYLFARTVFLKLFQFEQKNNKQHKKMALFRLLISNLDVTSRRNVNSFMTSSYSISFGWINIPFDSWGHQGQIQ